MADMKVNEPGMDDAQAQEDRHGWKTSVDMVTGKGRLAYFCDGAGPEVGNQYDPDPMGEEYNAVTYGGEPGPHGKAVSTPSALQEERSSGGRMVATAPQNYSRVGGKGD
jgi:hypothetical protein